jgi:tetratricopeptide (TPR) repeat protein
MKMLCRTAPASVDSFLSLRRCGEGRVRYFNLLERVGSLMPTPMSVCFMVMPFGKKPTQAGTDTIPVEIDFDLLWDKVYRPMILEDLHFTPIRADQDAGSLIIQTMIERLVISDLVIADVTLPNGNVYYEVGVRHAAQRQGCVLLAAKWSKPLFDMAQVRRVTFPLTEGSISDESAAALRKDLVAEVKAAIEHTGPVFQTLPGYPDRIKKEQLESFREIAGQVAEFQAGVSSARSLPRGEASELIAKLIEQYKNYAMAAPSMALDLVHLLRDGLNLDQGLEFISGLQKQVRELPVIREQRALMLAKSGKLTEAIVDLEALISGLLAGRYKSLYDNRFEEDEKANALNRAIACYERAVTLDLNDYFPSSNLPRLYRARMLEGDEQRAAGLAHLAQVACERARKRNPSDLWALLSLLGVAFDAHDVKSADSLLAELRLARPSPFYLNSTLPDLRRSLLQNSDPQTSAALAKRLATFQGWLDQKATVIAMAGRRIDAADADEQRFPAGNEGLVTMRIHNLLVGTACQAVVCAAACGADILALEIAGKLGLKRRVVLPFARDRFRATSVADRGEEWGLRFDAILNQLPARDVIELALEGNSEEVFSEGNAKILEQAIAWGAALKKHVLSMTVWNGFTRGATDMTNDFRSLALKRGLENISVLTL